jgi:hypothetical protein
MLCDLNNWYRNKKNDIPSYLIDVVLNDHISLFSTGPFWKDFVIKVRFERSFKGLEGSYLYN